MVLFGSYNLLIGYLIFRSTLLPRILGVLLAISGLCYLINCFANFLSPAFAAYLLPYILVPGGHDRYYKRIDAQSMTSSPSSERLRDARPAYRTELQLYIAHAHRYPTRVRPAHQAPGARRERRPQGHRPARKRQGRNAQDQLHLRFHGEGVG
jgi:hypothetical protein